jgi:hypothetical protein
MTTRSEELTRSLVADWAYHQARVLLLVTAVADHPEHQRKLDGLTKLAKLDFLVRYPALAPTVLDSLDTDDERLHLSPTERDRATDVEAPMTRYKYGPWDDRYYPVIGALVARGLLRYTRGRRGSVALAPTAQGRQLANEMSADPLWNPIWDRCAAVADGSGGLTGNALKNLVYDRLSDLMDRPHRETIR